MRLVRAAGRSAPGAVAVTGPGQVEAFQTARVVADAGEAVTGFAFSVTAGPSVTFTAPTPDDTTGGVGVREFEAPAVPGGTSVDVQVIAQTAGGDRVGSITVDVLTPVEFILRSGEWLPRRPMSIIRA